MSLPIPEEGPVYDYRIEDGGLFGSAGQGKKGEEEEEEEKAKGKTKVRIFLQTVCLLPFNIYQWVFIQSIQFVMSSPC